MDKVKFSNLLRELRVENGLTQQGFADIFNVSFQAVSKWENGESIPDILILEQISKFYNISINNLLNGVRDAIDIDKTQSGSTTKDSNQVDEESDFSLDLAKKRLPKLIFSLNGLLLYLILCTLPALASYKYYNYYNLLFSSILPPYGYFWILISFLAMISSMILGIISVFKKRNNVLVGIEMPLLIGGVLFHLIFNIMFIEWANVGCYILTFLEIAYLLMFMFIKQFNFNVLFTNKHQNEYNSIPFYIMYVMFVIFVNDAPKYADEKFLYYLFTFIGVAVYVDNIVLFILNFKFKSMKINVLKYISFGIAVGILILAHIRSLLVSLIVLAIVYIVLDIVNVKRVSKPEKICNSQ